MEERMAEMAALVLLGANAIQDARKREMLPWATLLGALLGGGLAYRQGIRPAEFAFGLAAGLCLMGLSGLSKGAVGMGDGLVVTALGCLLRWERVWESLLAGLLLCAGAAFLCLAGKRGKEQTLPFLPFLLAGHLLCLLSHATGLWRGGMGR